MEQWGGWGGRVGGKLEGLAVNESAGLFPCPRTATARVPLPPPRTTVRVQSILLASDSFSLYSPAALLPDIFLFFFPFFSFLSPSISSQAPLPSAGARSFKDVVPERFGPIFVNWADVVRTGFFFSVAFRH